MQHHQEPDVSPSAVNPGHEFSVSTDSASRNSSVHNPSEEMASKGRNTLLEEGTDVLLRTTQLPKLNEADKKSSLPAPAEGYGSGLVNSLRKIEQEAYAKIDHEMSFEQFLDKAFARPELYIRNVAEYTAQCMESFGVEEIDHLGTKILDFVGFRKWSWQSDRLDQRMELHGQEGPTYEYYKLCKLFGRQAHPDQMVVFHGPPGGGKTRLAETREASLEHYSRHHPEGALYRIVVVFDNEREFKKKTTGIGFDRATDRDDSPSKTEYRIPSSTHTNPIFLLSNERHDPSQLSPREKFYQDLADNGRIDENFNKTHLLEGKLDSATQDLVDRLLRYYKGDMGEVIKNHIRVERYTYSSQVGRGLVSIRPNPDRQSDVEALYPTHPLSKEVPEPLATTDQDVHQVQGLIPNANRGHVHFCDLLRENERDRSATDLSRLDYLLETIEGGKLQINSHRDPALYREESIDVLFSADTNDAHILQKRQGAGWEAFKQRCEFIVVPFIRRYLAEAAVHQQKLDKMLTNGREAAPHALETFALFATATRLLIPNPNNYAKVHEDLPEVIKGMNVVEKALLFQGSSKENPDRDLNIFRPEDKKLPAEKIALLKRHRAQIAEEHMQGVGETRFMLYDGGMGISTRESGKLLKRMVFNSPKEHFTVLDVIETLEQKLRGGFKFDQEVIATRDELRRELMEEIARADNENNYKGNQHALRRVTEKAETRMNELYPVAQAKDIVEQIKVYARAKIQADVYQALGLIDEENSIFLLKRYLDHVKAYNSRGNFQVARDYRVSSMSDGKPDENLMRDFEKEILKKSFYYDGDKDTFRSKAGSEIAAWVLNNPEKKFEHHVQEIFPDMINDIRKAQKDVHQKTLNEFLKDCEKYIGNPDALKQDLQDLGKRERVEAWKSQIEKLTKMGYPESSIAKHIFWVFPKSK